LSMWALGLPAQRAALAQPEKLAARSLPAPRHLDLI
jgi:hypothetical protein